MVAQQDTPPEPPRRRGGPRDMLLSMLVLAVLVLVLAGLTRSCAFSPGGPSVVPSAVPSADAGAGYARAVAELPFPVRQPALPPGWRTTSFDPRTDAGTPEEPGPALRVNYLTPQGHYLRLVESTLEEGRLLATETGTQPRGHGTVGAGGASWVVYAGQRDEPVWVTDAAGVRVLLTGDAGRAEFATLAAAVLAAPPG